MKKFLFSLSIVSSLFLASCEDEFADNNNNGNNNQETQDDGFWDVTCTQGYDSVEVTTCDSIWIQDSTQNQNNGTWDVVCDTNYTWDSLQNQVYTVDCQQVFVNGNSQGGYWDNECKTEYVLKYIETCDSVWVDTSNSDNNSGNDNSNNNNNNGNNANGNWTVECDTVYDQAQNSWMECDSIWVPAGS